jgi:N-acetylneuraminate synthase
MVVAELSGNHNGSIERARQLVREAAAAGADAIKLQTYTADTITMDAEHPAFIVDEPLWKGRHLYSLLAEASMPWSWQPELFALAEQLGMAWFSSPFDDTAVDFLEELGAPAYKIASSEIIDLALVDRAAATGKPVVLSAGMATAEEIDDAVATARGAGDGGIILLRCNATYPAPLDELGLVTIPDMARRWDVPVGFSDHTLGTTAAVAAVALGAVMVEKHLTLSRQDGGPDDAFSTEPAEFAAMAAGARDAFAALGTVTYGPTPSELPAVAGRRSLYVVRAVAPGTVLTGDHVRSIRPAGGLPPKLLPELLGRRAARAIAPGTPLTLDLLEP